MSRRRRRNWATARSAAWSRLGWKFWPVFVFGPLLLKAAMLLGVFLALRWLWVSVPHPMLAVGTGFVAVVAGVVVWLVRRRGGWGSWRRPLAVWSMTTAGVLVLGAAAWTALGGTV